MWQFADRFKMSSSCIPVFSNLQTLLKWKMSKFSSVHCFFDHNVITQLISNEILSYSESKQSWFDLQRKTIRSKRKYHKIWRRKTWDGWMIEMNNWAKGMTMQSEASYDYPMTYSTLGCTRLVQVSKFISFQQTITFKQNKRIIN